MGVRAALGGIDGLRTLQSRDFTGAVTEGHAWLFMLNGRIVGVFDGSLDSFADADGTAYAAPDPSFPLLFAMRETGGDTKARYYTNDTALSAADAKLSSGKFTGYIELSENVLSGDYYAVYYGGRRLACAFVGTGEQKQVLTGDEAFDAADDEVGIYEVVDVDIDVVERRRRPTPNRSRSRSPRRRQTTARTRSRRPNPTTRRPSPPTRRPTGRSPTASPSAARRPPGRPATGATRRRRSRKRPTVPRSRPPTPGRPPTRPPTRRPSRTRSRPRRATTPRRPRPTRRPPDGRRAGGRRVESGRVDGRRARGGPADRRQRRPVLRRGGVARDARHPVAGPVAVGHARTDGRDRQRGARAVRGGREDAPPTDRRRRRRGRRRDGRRPGDRRAHPAVRVGERRRRVDGRRRGSWRPSAPSATAPARRCGRPATASRPARTRSTA
ncbi:hypothetical protein ACFQRB_15215 [Halobaculum litoreum]|uniref:Uncharacterized protein n=1 Tax=Halobaculum litoreum TaxID=3031998 RepID=A0ABD5XW52_9EURY